MNELRALLQAPFTQREIDFTDAQWHIGIPSESGWYFIQSDAPAQVLSNLPSPPAFYLNDEGERKKCKNYDIRTRAMSLAEIAGLQSVVLGGSVIRTVYSGKTKNLLNRAREHTFSHPGTAGLALAKDEYLPLRNYTWSFHYQCNTRPYVSLAHRDVILKLGEQIWRSNNGWPLLCAG